MGTQGLKAVADQQEVQTLNQYVSDFSSSLPESFLDQLRSSPTLRATVIEAENLAQEAAVFGRTTHTDEEKDAFRQAWHAKVKEFSERVPWLDIRQSSEK
jgi:hypothetical protein